MTDPTPDALPAILESLQPSAQPVATAGDVYTEGAVPPYQDSPPAQQEQHPDGEELTYDKCGRTELPPFCEGDKCPVCPGKMKENQTSATGKCEGCGHAEHDDREKCHAHMGVQFSGLWCDCAGSKAMSAGSSATREEHVQPQAPPTEGPGLVAPVDDAEKSLDGMVGALKAFIQAVRAGRKL